MKNGFAYRLHSAWYRGASWLVLLVPLAWVYRACVALRRWLYRLAVLPVYRAGVPVVVVGNLTVGGSGKTPTVIALAQALSRRGLRPGIVARGYGATQRVTAHRLDASSTVADSGDEMMMVYESTGFPCAVAPRRSEAVQLLEASGEVDIVLADDGLQHYGLARDFEIVLYDADAAFGNGRCLPAGPLREPLSRLREVDCVLSRTAQPSDESVALVPRALIHLRTSEQYVLDGPDLPETITQKISREIVAVAGVGQPALFFRQLRDLGFVVEERAFPDHHIFSEADLAVAPDQSIIMTAKDAVKCRTLAGADTWYLAVDAVLPLSVVERVAALAEPSANVANPGPNRETT